MERKILLLILMLGMLTGLSAQKVNQDPFLQKNDSLIREKAEKLIDDYFMYGGISESGMDYSSYYENKFKELFTSDAMLIYDLDESVGGVTVDNYVEKLLEKFPRGINISLKNTEFLEYFGDENTAVVIPPEFYKGVVVRVEKNILGFTYDYERYTDTVSMDMMLVFNKALDNFKIANIYPPKVERVEKLVVKFDLGKNKLVPPPFKIKYQFGNDKTVKTEMVTQGTLEIVDIPVKEQIRFFMPKESKYEYQESPYQPVTKLAEDGYHFTLTKKKVWTKLILGAAADIGISAISANNLRTNDVNNYGTWSESMSPGFNFDVTATYYFFKSNNLFIGAKVGAGLSMLSHQMQLDTYNDKISFADGDQSENGQLIVDGNQLNYDVSVTNLDVPVNLSLLIDKQKSPIFNTLEALYVNAGVIITKPFISDYSGNGELGYSGYYDFGPGFDPIVLTDVGSLGLTSSSFNVSDEWSTSSMVYSAMFEFGGVIPVKKPNLEIEVGFTYHQTLTSISDFSETEFNLSNQEGNFTNLSNIYDAYEDLKPYHFGLNIGVRYKIFK